MAINLVKGQRIDLRKGTGRHLLNFCVGVNWGAIQKTVVRQRSTGGFLGIGSKTENYSVNETIKVDLDLSCILLDSAGNLCDYIYSPLYKKSLLKEFGLPEGKMVTFDGALAHSGDDLEGDSGGDDGLDNEIITVNLSELDNQVSSIFFFLNNVGKEDFSQIPHAKIRMYEGTPTLVREEFASYNIASDSQYQGKRALILGKLYKKDDGWRFQAIGDPTDDVFIGQTIHRIIQSYS